MIARAVALVSFPFAPSSTSKPDPLSLQRLMVLFPELIQYSSSVSKSMERPKKKPHGSFLDVTPCPTTRGCCNTQQSSLPLTNGAFLVGEQDAAIAAVCVGHVNGVTIGPVKFPEAGRGECFFKEVIKVQKWRKLNTNIVLFRSLEFDRRSSASRSGFIKAFQSA